MSREFIDDNLVTWEVYASTGRFSLPEEAYLVFLCVTHAERRPRTIRYQGDAVDAEAAVESLGDETLRGLLGNSRELS